MKELTVILVIMIMIIIIITIIIGYLFIKALSQFPLWAHIGAISTLLLGFTLIDYFQKDSIITKNYKLTCKK